MEEERSLWSYFVECLTKKFFCFEGRARRREYWGFYLFTTIFTILTCGLGFLVLFIPLIAVFVRRFHDLGKTGKWAFVSFGAGLL